MDSPESPLEDSKSRISLVGAARSLVALHTVPDEKDIDEISSLDAERAVADLNNAWLLIELRKKYGRNIVRFLWVYFLFTALCVLMSGAKFHGFSLPDGVLTALIGGTAVSVIGVVGTVAAGLFKQPK